MMARLQNKSLLRRKRPMEEGEMDITPMIDCTFLLLIFFLVTSRMKAQTPLDLPKARHGAVVVEQGAVIITIAKGQDEQVRVFKGQSRDLAQEIKGANLVEQEEAIARYVEQQANTTPPKRNVLIKAERGLKHRDVARVQKAAARAEVEQLYVAVLEIQ
jgi:biopolymer transport protein ExbD